MCRVEERVYIDVDGSRSKLEDVFRCDKARQYGDLCEDTEIYTKEYYTGRPSTPDGQELPSSTPSGLDILRKRRSSGPVEYTNHWTDVEDSVERRTTQNKLAQSRFRK
jgi:hypothetical protein